MIAGFLIAAVKDIFNPLNDLLPKQEQPTDRRLMDARG